MQFSRHSAEQAEQLGSEITELCGYIYAATYQLLVMIAEFDRKKYWEAQGFQTCAHWLNFNCGLGMGSARERIRVAHALGRLPKIAAMFAKGQLSYSKVRAVTRVADETNEDDLLNFAEYGSAHQVERLVAQYRRAGYLQDADKVNRQYQERAVSYYYDLDGSMVMKVKMPADRGELLIKALEQMMERNRRDVVTEESIPNPKARRADALVHIAQASLENGNLSGSSADRYQVVVHLKEDGSTIENGPNVAAATSERISCDCSKVTIKEDETGEPLSVGRRTRIIPPAIRRALVARDGGCRFPGCTNHRFVVGHHIMHWSEGGHTSLDNLVLLCEHHHHLVHEGGFDCRRSEGGEIFFVDRKDEPISTHVVPRLISIPNLLASMRKRFKHAQVTSRSCISRQTDEKIDWRLVDVPVAFPRERRLP